LRGRQTGKTGKTDPKTFLGNNKKRIINLVKQRKKPIKIKFLLECEFYKMNKKEMVYSFSYFHSKIEIITEATNIEDVYKRSTENILEKFANYQNRGSGWIFSKIVNLDIHVDKYKPVAAKSFIELPQKLRPGGVRSAIAKHDGRSIRISSFASDRQGIRISG
jgi:hypothetical protein